MLQKCFASGTNSACTNLALLVLRVWLGATMVLNHGLSKLKSFSELSSNFPDPLGVGHAASLALAVFAEVVCAVLLILGLLTRFGALVLAINLAVAFCFVHKGALSGEHSGELAFIYLAGCVTLLVAGGGRFSMDQSLFAKKDRSAM